MINNKKVIALCTSRIYDPQTHNFIETLNELLRVKDCRLFIYAITSDVYWDEDKYFAETSVFDIIPFDKTDTLVIMDERIKSRHIVKNIIAEASAHSVPVIVIDGDYDDTITVNFDYETGFESIVRHVIEDHSVRRPHFMAGFRGNVFSDTRLEVFKKVIKENGIAFDNSMVSYGEFWAKPAREAAGALISSGNIPEAVICANDIMAINVCDVLTSAGIDVPSQVIVTGFDGLAETNFSSPKIATVNCESYELAKAVEQSISDCLNGIKAPSVSVTPKLMPNESCGCACRPDLINSSMDHFNHNFYRYQDDMRILHDLSIKIQTAVSPEQAFSLIYNELAHNVCCVVNNDCFCSDKNYFRENAAADDQCVIYSSYSNENGIFPFSSSQIIPDLERLIKTGYPLIFNALSYMDKPMGYVCYSFENYDITDYSKTSSITSAVSMGLGGYINMRYQQHLLNKVEEMYKYDLLTGLYNRTGFKTVFEKVKSSPRFCGQQVTLIMTDLDELKHINDNFGHDEGDRAIAAAAHALKKASPADSLCVRFGGDEMFSLAFGECDSDEIIRQINEQLDKYNEDSDAVYEVRASCGAYSCRMTENFDLNRAIDLADEKMYDHKKSSKRCERFKSEQSPDKHA